MSVRRLTIAIGEPPDDLGGAIAIADHEAARNRAPRRVAGHVAIEPAQACIAVGDDGSKRLLTSWAMEAVNSPSIRTRAACAKSACTR